MWVGLLIQRVLSQGWISQIPFTIILFKVRHRSPVNSVGVYPSLFGCILDIVFQHAMMHIIFRAGWPGIEFRPHQSCTDIVLQPFVARTLLANMLRNYSKLNLQQLTHLGGACRSAWLGLKWPLPRLLSNSLRISPCEANVAGYFGSIGRRSSYILKRILVLLRENSKLLNLPDSSSNVGSFKHRDVETCCFKMRCCYNTRYTSSYNSYSWLFALNHCGG